MSPPGTPNAQGATTCPLLPVTEIGSDHSLRTVQLKEQPFVMRLRYSCLLAAVSPLAVTFLNCLENNLNQIAGPRALATGLLADGRPRGLLLGGIAVELSLPLGRFSSSASYDFSPRL
jgi:hypothetical protein